MESNFPEQLAILDTNYNDSAFKNIYSALKPLKEEFSNYYYKKPDELNQLAEEDFNKMHEDLNALKSSFLDVVAENIYYTLKESYIKLTRPNDNYSFKAEREFKSMLDKFSMNELVYNTIINNHLSKEKDEKSYKDLEENFKREFSVKYFVVGEMYKKNEINSVLETLVSEMSDDVKDYVSALNSRKKEEYLNNIKLQTTKEYLSSLYVKNFDLFDKVFG